jgi:hypothetical protein
MIREPPDGSRDTVQSARGIWWTHNALHDEASRCVNTREGYNDFPVERETERRGDKRNGCQKRLRTAQQHIRDTHRLSNRLGLTAHVFPRRKVITVI